MVIELYCPVNLDIKAVVSANPFDKTNKGMKVDYLSFIIHSIMVQRANKDEDHLRKIGKSGGFVPLHSKILQSKIPNYHNHIKYLQDLDIIECDGMYIPEKVSMGYRLKNPYRLQDFKRVPITDFILCKKIKADFISNKNNLAEKELPHLTKFFKSGKLQIDVSGAYNWINEYELKNISSINLKSQSSAKKLEKLEQLNETCKNFKLLVNRISVNDFYCHIDTTGKRLHTNLTNLPKGLRQFLMYDNQPLVSVDIKNSQPYISTILLKKEFWQSKTIQGKPSLKSIDKELYNKLRKDKNKYNNIIKFLDSSKTLTTIDIQKQQYINHAISGKFYEYLVSVFEYALNISSLNDAEKRIKIKKMVLTILFDDDHKIYNVQKGALMQIFKKRFSTVSKVFEFIKKGDYRNLAVVLQRIESDLVLNRVCKLIAKSNPEIPLFTIHDSIVTTAGNENYVKAIMEREIGKAIGATPHFETENWQEEIIKSVGAM